MFYFIIYVIYNDLKVLNDICKLCYIVIMVGYVFIYFWVIWFVDSFYSVVVIVKFMLVIVFFKFFRCGINWG